MGGIGLIFAHQLYPAFGGMFVGVSHPTADLHFLGRGRSEYDLSAAQALLEVTQITFEIRQALLVGLLAFCRLFGVQGLQFGDFSLQQVQALRRDVIGLRADLPFDRLIGLRGGVIFIDEGTAHGILPV
ncbi:hypothetical protein D3C85_1263380 [compost metagenome]